MEISAAGAPVGRVSYHCDECTYELIFSPSATSLLAESAKTIDFRELETDLGGGAKVGFAKYSVEQFFGTIYHDFRQVLGLDVSRPPRGQKPVIKNEALSGFSRIPARELLDNTQRCVYVVGRSETPEFVGQILGIKDGSDVSLTVRKTGLNYRPGLSAEDAARVFTQVLVAFRENWVQNYLEPAI